MYKLLSLIIIFSLSISCGSQNPETLSISKENNLSKPDKVNIGSTDIPSDSKIDIDIEPETHTVEENPSNITNTPTITLTPTSIKTEINTTEAPTVIDIIPSYDRDQWNHWTDLDKDCQNTRHEVLQIESLIPVTFKDDSQCQVEFGEWYDAYTGATIKEASKLDIDHMIPLKNAHISGGWKWDKVKKSEYANYIDYEGHLIAVSASANRQKGAKSPDEWKPSNQKYWCDYATDWVAIKNIWQLDFTKSESDAIKEMLDTCESSNPTSSPIPTLTSSQVSSLEFSDIDCKGKPESVVVSNNGYIQQAMNGWKIYDEGSKHTFNFPNEFILNPNMSVTIITGANGYDSDEKIFWKNQTVWNNTGDEATLIDNAGKIIDTMKCP